MKQKYLLGGLISLVVSIIAFFLNIKLDNKYGLIGVAITYFIIGIVLVPVINFIILKSKSKGKKEQRIPYYILGLLMSLAILLISTKIMNTITRLTYPLSFINAIIITFLVIIAPILVFIYLNKLFAKKLVKNEYIKRSMSISSYLFVAILIIGFFFPIPFLYLIIRPSISIPLIIIILILLGIEIKNGSKNNSKGSRGRNTKKGK